MKYPGIPLLPALLLSAAMAAGAAEAVRTENKNVTVVAASSSSDGSSEITREKVQDCIASLPDPEKVEALVSSEALFVQGVNGVTGRNEWVKAYTARLDITYMTHEKDLIIVTTRSVQGQAPVFREVDKSLRHTQTFVSNPTEGDAYGGRSDRRYYFTTAEGAIRDVKTRARIWISQQAPGVCGVK
jgi:hypothetical protein